jgi:hypothetical protein
MPFDRRGPIPSHSIGRRGSRLPFRVARPPGLAVHPDVGYLGPWWTEAFMRGPALIRASLSDVRVIMAIMHVLVVKLMC